MTINIEQMADEIVKSAADISKLDPKIQNRIGEVKKIYQKIKVIQDSINEQVSDLQSQIKDLEKQAKIFEKQLMPTLSELEDHAVEAEGIFIQLKKGRRSPKVGYEYLADKVTSELLMAAEDAITDAAKFAKGLTIKVSKADGTTKTAGITDWLKKQWDNLVSFVTKLKNRNKSIKNLLTQLKKAT